MSVFLCLTDNGKFQVVDHLAELDLTDLTLVEYWIIPFRLIANKLVRLLQSLSRAEKWELALDCPNSLKFLYWAAFKHNRKQT